MPLLLGSPPEQTLLKGIGKYTLTLAGPCIITQIKQINQPDVTVLQVYYLTFCVAQHVSGASTPLIMSLQLH
jgi:hypothetical protein